ncbi:hypothetical protein KFK09_027590 [Dendrobium nobile]|uniref:Retroviral polymerase SH3-like domain-containing protein n=1 Tax=Dendrobium nobile TaxID=94219 RepID=A0A8T3AB60_DENNO|nr:hypothetical protein KFK09_027590 [Dendrobium nobile]
MPSRNTQSRSPYELLYKQTPDYKHLRIFGTLCYPWLKPHSSNKLSPVSKPCVFIGYPDSQKGYKCLDPISNQVYTSCHVIFDESIFPFASPYPPNSIHSNANLYTPPLLLVPTSNPCTTQHSTPHISSHSNYTPPAPQNTNTNSTEVITSTCSSPHPSSSQPEHTSPIIPTSTHPMVTRLRHGISKPKKVFNLAHSVQHIEPTTYLQAAKSEH